MSSRDPRGTAAASSHLYNCIFRNSLSPGNKNEDICEFAQQLMT